MIRTAVLGAGKIGSRHIKLLQEDSRFTLCGICDINSNKKSLADELDIPFFHQDFEILEIPDLEVVHICTPNGYHAEQTIRALKKGIHVVCEKPMALTVTESKAMCQASENSGKHIFCVMQNRYSPPAQWLKKVIDENLIGTVSLVQINCFWNRDNRYYTPGNWRGTKNLDGGVLFTQFSHFVDLAYWLFGSPKVVYSRLENFLHQETTEFPDTGTALLELPGGGLLTFTFTTNAWDKNLESSITVFGAEGTLKIGGQYMEKVEMVQAKNLIFPELPPSNPPNNYGQFTGSASNHQRILDNVFNTLRGTALPDAGPEQGLAVVEIIEDVHKKAIVTE